MYRETYVFIKILDLMDWYREVTKLVHGTRESSDLLAVKDPSDRPDGDITCNGLVNC